MARYYNKTFLATASAAAAASHQFVLSRVRHLSGVIALSRMMTCERDVPAGNSHQNMVMQCSNIIISFFWLNIFSGLRALIPIKFMVRVGMAPVDNFLIFSHSCRYSFVSGPTPDHGVNMVLSLDERRKEENKNLCQKKKQKTFPG